MTTGRDEQFLALYETYRRQAQTTFYVSRIREFSAAHEQGILLLSVLMLAGAVAGALAGIDFGGLRPLWGVLGAAFPAIGTALTAYDKLYAFDQQAKVYRDAAHALARAHADEPILHTQETEDERLRVVREYVDKMESVFRREHGQWGQLSSQESPQVSPPETRARTSKETDGLSATNADVSQSPLEPNLSQR